MTRLIVALAVGLLLLAVTANAAGGRELLQSNKNCPALSANAVESYNKAKGTFFESDCFEPVGTKGSCGTKAGGLCIYSNGLSCFYRARPCKPTDSQVLGLFAAWNAALKTLDSQTVANMYAPTAVLLPTVSNQYRTTRDEIIDYFDHFLPKGPQGALDKYEIRHLADGVVQLLGIYTFTMTLQGNAKVQARFSYTYARQANGKWLIVEHHSSAMPENEAQLVMDAFAQWNAALATKNASKVASLYAPTAVLLPTVSDKVRNTPAEIEDYFVSFLKKEPQGVIDNIDGTSPNVRFLAPDVAVNSGTYVFTLKNDDGSRSKVRARYTYVYKKYGGKYLIEDHHSSVMPETAGKVDE
ncbi:hypothetical protein HYH02_003479 [Chlamydomonas schloesseri]|uniref:Calcium/calmodulin-dependent protein kinase II association-domain domain-containing protein n=1 Tax=Chlamydomonas schloesseri TaxID=2026947 RepID=A0A835WQR5_9CHLO|nr:hypothetical protein HYH02_003479 [Chlamydomonas schloesseri]|eukprot:KAG2451699.1 hypothetical protein HYH02_003479 [Chlamydomonas schloesseri]